MTEEVNVKQVTAASDFSGQVALVTGAGKGLGRASALALAGAGARVIAVARTEDDLKELQSHYPNTLNTGRRMYWKTVSINELRLWTNSIYL